MIVRAIRRGLVLVVVAGLLGAASGAAAQSAEPEEEEARALFRAGSVAYEQGQFERALDYFQRAYELSPRAGMLFNLGNTYDRLGQTAQALEHLRRYLEEVPDAPNAAFVRRRVDVLAAQVEPAAPEPTPTEQPVAAIAFLVAGGTLALASVGTVAWWVERNEAIDQCNLVSCANGPVLDAERDAAMGITITAAILGLAGLTTGIVLLLIRPEAGSPAASLRCAPGLGLVCEGRF